MSEIELPGVETRAPSNRIDRALRKVWVVLGIEVAVVIVVLVVLVVLSLRTNGGVQTSLAQHTKDLRTQQGTLDNSEAILKAIQSQTSPAAEKAEAALLIKVEQSVECGVIDSLRDPVKIPAFCPQPASPTTSTTTGGAK